MPALSPTMEEGKLAKWLVKEGQTIKAGDIIAEIETDKATMEVEASDEGKLGKILVAEGTEGVKVNTPIATLLARARAEGRRSIPRLLRPRRHPALDLRGKTSPQSAERGSARHPQHALRHARVHTDISARMGSRSDPAGAGRRGAARCKVVPLPPRIGHMAASSPRRWRAGWPGSWASTPES